MLKLCPEESKLAISDQNGFVLLDALVFDNI